MDEELNRPQSDERSVVLDTNSIMSRGREECISSYIDESHRASHDVGRSYSVAMKPPSSTGSGIIIINHHGHCNSGRIRSRCEFYLGFTIASIISISGIASSSAHSGVKTAAITFSSLSFIVTAILGVGYFSGRMRDILTSNPLSRSQHERKLGRKVAFEKVAVSMVLLLECIISGLVLYPQFSSSWIAVAGNEVWNPNVFYITWFSLYASAYLAADAFCKDGYCLADATDDVATHDQSSSVKSAWFMCLFSTTCTATSLLIIQSGPACRGDYIDDTPYCSSALAAGSVSAVCVVALLVCGVCHMQPVRRNIQDMTALKSRKLMMIIGATVLLISQCAIVAKVTAPSGPGHATGNAFITTWMSLIASLLLWKTSVESCFMLQKHELTLSQKVEQAVKESKSTTTTDDEVSSDEDHCNSCDQFCDMPTDFPKEVQAGGGDYCNNLRGSDPEEGLNIHTIFNSHSLSQRNQVQAGGNRLLEEADAVLTKVKEYHSRPYVAKMHTTRQTRRHESESRPPQPSERREDPRGFRCNKNVHRSRRKSQEHAKEPPSSREEAMTRAKRSPLPVPSHLQESVQKSVVVDRKQDFCARIPPLPMTSDTFITPPTNEEFKVRITSVPMADAPKSLTPTPPPRRASFVSNMSPLHETSKDGDTRHSSSSLSSENGCKNDEVDYIVGSRTPTSNGGTSQKRWTPPPLPPPPPRSRNDTSLAPPSKHREKKPHKGKDITATTYGSSSSRSAKHGSSSERFFASTPSLLAKKSPDPDMGSIPFDVLLNEEQSVVTEITAPIADICYSIPAGTGDRKLSIAVAAALHAAAVSANTEKKATASNEVANGIHTCYRPKRTSSKKERSLSPSTQRQSEGQSVSLQSSNMFDGSVGSPMTEEISLISTLEQAQKLRTYSDLEDSKLNIQGNNATTSTDIVGILKNNEDSGNHRKTPSNASSKLSGTPSNKSQKRYQNEPDLVVRALSARMKGGPTEGVPTSMQGLGVVNKSLNRRQGNLVQQLSQDPSNSASLESRSRLASSSAERRGSTRSYFSVVDDSHTVHGEFEC